MNEQDKSSLPIEVTSAEYLVLEIRYIVPSNGKGCHSPPFLSFSGLICTNDFYVKILLEEIPFNRSGAGLFPSNVSYVERYLPIVVISGRKHFQYLDCVAITLLTTRTVGSLAYSLHGSSGPGGSPINTRTHARADLAVAPRL